MNEKLNQIKLDKRYNFDFTEINFLSDFLLWLIYKKSVNEKISEKIVIERGTVKNLLGSLHCQNLLNESFKTKY